MKRPFEFRVWDSESSTFWTPEKQGSSTAISLHGKLCVGYIDGDMCAIGEEDLKSGKFVIQQFTGALDRHKKKIFEGDICIVNFRAMGQRKCTVQYMTDGYECKLAGFRFIAVENNTLLHDTAEVIEIIGNVMENPELLKP